MNFRRRSTVGWSIQNVLLDFTGGWLSVSQLLLQCAVTSDWTQIAGNPVKFGLGFVSMLFDILFMVQHYVLYPKVPDPRADAHSDAVAGFAPDDDRPESERKVLLHGQASDTDGQNGSTP
jgi:cystinosin